jgi:Skp family chaperone for outer membrane proteins
MRILMAAILFFSTGCFAQAPVETGRPSGENLQRDQIKAGNAYRDMQRAEQAARDAEQEFRQSDAVYKDAQKRAEEARYQADAAKKKLDAAKARETQTRKAYDAAVNAVDRDAHPAKKK